MICWLMCDQRQQHKSAAIASRTHITIVASTAPPRAKAIEAPEERIIDAVKQGEIMPLRR
jgi:hypothetical protein